MSAPQSAMRQINIRVSEKVVAKLETMAREAGTSTTAMAGYLFNAAYTARLKGTTDADLDAHVALVGLATMGGASLAQLAAGTGLPLKTLKRMQKAWQDVLSGRKSAA